MESGRRSHAREGNVAPGPSRQARGEGPVEPGWRVRARGDAPHPRGQAWRPLDEAGDRDRPVEGTPCRRRPEGTRQGQDVRAHATKRAGRPAPRSEETEAVGATLTSDG